MNAAAQTNDTILQVEHLSMKFGGLIAIGDLSFQARRGEITALIGPNGAGKTTVFNCITGFYKPTEGMITLTRRDGSKFLLERLPNHEIPARAKVARTFQNIRLFSGMTLLENLLVAQHNKLMKASGYTLLGLFGFSGYRQASAESIDLARHWLEKADLIDRADDPAGDLPYGAQRRLEIARAMCTGPELLCLDEPAAGLNPRESLALNSLLMSIKNETGTSILLIEHDMSVVMQISDHVVVLEYGRKISDGNPASVKSDPRVIAAYLGVDDEEVTEVLSEVGDDSVIEQLDAHPDPAHGPGASASMMAGPVSETTDHIDDERVAVSKGASKAEQVDRANAAKPAAKPALHVAETVKSAPSAPPMAPKAAAKAEAKPVAKAATPAKGAPAAKAVPPAKATAKEPPAAKAAPQAAATPAAKSAPAKAAPASKAATSSASGRPAGKSPAVAKPAARAAAGSAATKPVAKAGATAKPATPAKTAAPAKPKTISNTLAAPRGGKADNLLVIKGIGPVNLRKLNEHGIFHFDQIAAWKQADIEAAEAYLAFDGRIAREDWIGQAKALARQAAAPATGKRGGRK